MIRRFADRARQYLLTPLYTHPVHAAQRMDPAAQIALMQVWRDLRERGGPFPRFQDVGFQVYSQVDEDGLLLYLFSLIGTTNKCCVEMCAGNGAECNAANLVLNHRWTGLLFDGDQNNVASARRFYARSPVYVSPPSFVHAWITRDNINDLIRDGGMTGEIDLFSLDIDGVDYWLWDALTVVAPRVVVLEFQTALGPDRCCTLPYAAEHRVAQSAVSDFFGASLPAFIKLGKRKGYRYVGCNGLSFNAFFVRNDIGADLLPEADYREAFAHPRVQRALMARGAGVHQLPWEEV